MNIHKLTFFIVTLMIATAHGKPYGDDNNDLYSNDEYEDLEDGNEVGESEKVILELPKFRTKSQKVIVNEGSTIRLPCIVNKLEGFIQIWRRGDDILTVANQVVKEDLKSRMSVETVENGNYITIPLAEGKDEGEYSCTVSSLKPMVVNHTVKIRVKPEVQPIPDNGIIVAKSGDSVTLGCQVTKGSPAPEVKWRRKERKLPSGEESINGLSMTFTSVTRRHSGVYICSADNGFGEPSTAVLRVDVQHAPEIEQEETFVHTREGDTTEVICVVHASPKAEVQWYKNGLELDSSTNQITNVGNRHVLTLPVTTEQSFGQYMCRATNSYGESQKTTEVSGKAEPAIIKSHPKGAEYNRFPLEWTAISYTPISNFRVEFKQVGDDKWRADETTAIKLPHEEKVFTGTYVLPNLRPATIYLARVASRNSYGYSNPSKVFKFATRGADPVQNMIKGNSAGSSISSSLTTSIFFALSALFLL